VDPHTVDGAEIELQRLLKRYTGKTSGGMTRATVVSGCGGVDNWIVIVGFVIICFHSLLG
jgi:hypothetical protein